MSAKIASLNKNVRPWNLYHNNKADCRKFNSDITALNAYLFWAAA